MPRKLAIIEIETGGDERLCSEKCQFFSLDGCRLFDSQLLYERPDEFVRADACFRATRLASLDRAVVEAAEKWRDYEPRKPGPDATRVLAEAVDERRKANGADEVKPRGTTHSRKEPFCSLTKCGAPVYAVTLSTKPTCKRCMTKPRARKRKK